LRRNNMEPKLYHVNWKDMGDNELREALELFMSSFIASSEIEFPEKLLPYFEEQIIVPEGEELQ